MQEAAVLRTHIQQPPPLAFQRVAFASESTVCLFPLLWVLSKFALLPKRDKGSWGVAGGGFPNRDAKRQLLSLGSSILRCQSWESF